MRSQRDQIIWGNVEKILKDKDWNLAELAKEMGITPQAVNSLKTKGIGSRSIKKLASALKVDEILLLSIDAPSRHPNPIPVISWVRAGVFAEAVDHWPAGISGEGDPVHSVKIAGPHTFALRIEGDSMAPRYLPGDIIVVDPEIKCDNGSPCVVVVNGEATFKIFRETPDAIVLEALNPKYPKITIDKGTPVDFRVVGKVVDLIAKL